MHNKGRHILCSDGGDMMRKFKIPSIPPTTNKCIRIPNDVIAGGLSTCMTRICLSRGDSRLPQALSLFDRPSGGGTDRFQDGIRAG